MYIRIKKVSKYYDTVYNLYNSRVWKPVENEILISIKKHKFSFSQVLYNVSQIKELALYDILFGGNIFLKMD